MFNKKCKKCGAGISKKHRFCPSCGNLIGDDKENWGLLGKDDFIPEQNFSQVKLPFGFNALFNSLLKNLDKELSGMEKNNSLGRGMNINISISGNRLPKMIPKRVDQKTKPLHKLPVFSAEKQKKFSELEKQEPSANTRRLSNRLIYEINIPKVKSLEDVSVLKLENSTEIKALAKDKAYKKIIPVNYPIISYGLDKEILVLEFAGN